MSEHVFSDPARQLIIRLSDERLVYTPADTTGWQCRVEQICWTSSRMTSRGIQEINLHGAGGRVAVTLLPFDGIERFYLTLLRILTARPFFNGVREQMPTQVPLMERVLWIADQVGPADRQWDYLEATEGGVVVATENAVLAMNGAEPHLERIPWGELTGIRSRGEASRLFRENSWVTVGVPTLETDLAHLWDCRKKEVGSFQFPGLRTLDSRLAMDHSWELERAAADELLDKDETVLACAYGTGKGSLVPGEAGAAIPGALTSLGSVIAVVASDETPPRSELLLTDKRLLHIDRDPRTMELLSQVEVELDRLPRLRQVNAVLILGRFELLTDARHPAMATRFMEQYRNLVADRFDPFGERSDAPATATLNNSNRPDPFAAVLEKPLDLSI